MSQKREAVELAILRTRDRYARSAPEHALLDTLLHELAKVAGAPDGHSPPPGAGGAQFRESRARECCVTLGSLFGRRPVVTAHGAIATPRCDSIALAGRGSA